MADDELGEIDELLRSQRLSSLTLEQQRAAVERASGSLPDGTTVEPVDARGVPCEWVAMPGADPVRTVVSLRGGGYCLGSLRSNRYFSALLSAATSATVLNVGYRSAPEHPYPAALDDAVVAYRWLVDREVPTASVALAGNSAGGGLALATLLALRDAGDELPSCAAVISPWTDLAGTGASLTDNAATDPMLDADHIASTAALYAPARQLTDPYVSPLYGDLRGLPPILIHVSAAEILRDDGVRFARRASAQGVAIELSVVEGVPHVWHLFAGLLAAADDSLAALGAWLAGRTAGPNGG